MPNPNAYRRRLTAKGRNISLSLRADEAASAGVMRVCDVLLQNAVKRIEHPSRSREESIHAVRICIKYVRAILRLIRSAIGDSAFRREDQRLKKTASLLASMRDATIGLQTLRGLAKTTSSKKKRSNVSIVHARFAKHTAPPRAVVLEGVLRATVRTLEAHCRRLRKLRVANGDISALSGVWSACIARADDA